MFISPKQALMRRARVYAQHHVPKERKKSWAWISKHFHSKPIKDAALQTQTELEK